MDGRRPLIEPHDTQLTTMSDTFDVDAGGGSDRGLEEQQSPITAFFDATRWQRDDVIVLLAALQLLLLLIRLYLLMTKDNVVLGGVTHG
jgi:hypothetical protein